MRYAGGHDRKYLWQTSATSASIDLPEDWCRFESRRRACRGQQSRRSINDIKHSACASGNDDALGRGSRRSTFTLYGREREHAKAAGGTIRSAASPAPQLSSAGDHVARFVRSVLSRLRRRLRSTTRASTTTIVTTANSRIVTFLLSVSRGPSPRDGDGAASG